MSSVIVPHIILHAGSAEIGTLAQDSSEEAILLLWGVCGGVCSSGFFCSCKLSSTCFCLWQLRDYELYKEGERETLK